MWKFADPSVFHDLTFSCNVLRKQPILWNLIVNVLDEAELNEMMRNPFGAAAYAFVGGECLDDEGIDQLNINEPTCEYSSRMKEFGKMVYSLHEQMRRDSEQESDAVKAALHHEFMTKFDDGRNCFFNNIVKMIEEGSSVHPLTLAHEIEAEFLEPFWARIDQPPHGTVHSSMMDYNSLLNDPAILAMNQAA